MRIYDRKRLIWGFGFFLLAAAGIAVFFHTGFRSFSWKTAVVFSLLLLLSINDITGSLSKRKTVRARIDRMDERNRFLALKCRAKALDFLQFLLFLLAAGCMIGFGSTKEDAFLWMFLGAALPFGAAQFLLIFFMFWYEKHE